MPGQGKGLEVAQHCDGTKLTGYRPPYEITPVITGLVSSISEAVGRLTSTGAHARSVRTARGNRLRTVQASLAIENNTLSLEQVTAVIEGRRVLGLEREIREVRNAYEAYERLDRWKPWLLAHIEEAHGVMMKGLVDDPGQLRRGGVGVFKDREAVHVAPPASRVKGLIGDLLGWVARSEEHPLIVGAVAHYELEFIHPFTDGNGRIGRLWQTLILSRWRPVLGYVPVESVVADLREEYYGVLGAADRRGNAAGFVEFILGALEKALEEVVATDQATDHVTDQVRRLMERLASEEMGSAGLMKELGLSHRPTFAKNYLGPALEQGLVERTQPDSPRSPTQKYRLTVLGRGVLDG